MFVTEAALIALRESLEAFLITGILLGFVSKLGRPDARTWVWTGLAAGIAASILLGLLVNTFLIDAFEGGGEQWYEMSADLVAVAVLTYMVFWMWKHTRTLVGALREKVSLALARDTLWVIALLVFVSVVREGIEMVLFYAALASEDSAFDLGWSALAGTTIAVALVVAIFKGTTAVNLQKFFAITGVFLIFIASGLLMHAVHEAEEIGIIPEGDSVWDTGGVIPSDRVDGRILGALIGYRPAPTLLQVIVYFGYLLGVGIPYLASLGVFGRRASPDPGPEGATTPAATPQPTAPVGPKVGPAVP